MIRISGINRNRFKKEILKMNPDIEEEYLMEKMAEGKDSLEKDMTGHLSALNDGVIAIFITVMMLEIPYPTTKTEYFSFLWSIVIFLVSFFIIGDFWYTNKGIFQVMKKADHWVVVANFMFLAALALIPVNTKWIMNQADRYSALNFGLIYLVTLIMQQILFFAIIREQLDHRTKVFFKFLLLHDGILLLIDAILIVIGWFFPHVSMVLFISIPVLNFFMPSYSSQKKELLTDSGNENSSNSN